MSVSVSDSIDYFRKKINNYYVKINGNNRKIKVIMLI